MKRAQQTSLDIDTRERDLAPIDLSDVDLTKYAPGMAVRGRRVLVRCPECGKTGEPQRAIFSKPLGRVIRPVAHLFVQSASDRYVARALCNADPDAVKAAIKSAEAGL